MLETICLFDMYTMRHCFLAYTIQYLRRTQNRILELKYEFQIAEIRMNHFKITSLPNYCEKKLLTEMCSHYNPHSGPILTRS